MESGYVYDVAVIGAGPAGSEFAYRMANANFKVIVLEKDKPSREKPCGGGIPVQEMIEFGKLPGRVVERRIKNAKIISPGNNVLGINLVVKKMAGATVKRAAYDSFLQERAEKAGAVLVKKCRALQVKQTEDLIEITAMHEKTKKGKQKKRYSAKLVADASGYSCSIKGVSGKSRKLDDKDVVATYHVWVKLPETKISGNIGNTTEMYCGKDVIPKGYAWIFPKKNLVSVGIGATKDSIMSGKLSLRKLLFDFIKRHPLASKKLKGGRVVKTGGGLIPVALLPKLYSNRIIFIGDAGGFANPLNGGGIYQARKSAAIASKFCIRFLKAKNGMEREKALKNYDDEAREAFYNRGSKWDIKLRNLLWSEELLTKVIEKANKKKKLKEHIGFLLSMTKPHEKAYRLLESEMLDIIHSMAAEKVERYKKIVDKELGLFKKNEGLDSFARHSFFGKAKRLRVSLVLLACDLFKGDIKKASKLAPVYELLHTASLVHDDIMDDSKTRRGKKALHNICGVDKAIVAGDFMFGKTYGVLSRGFSGMPESRIIRILSVIGDCTTRCCHGQVMDLELSEKKRYSRVDDYLRMVGLKTGSMIEGAMKNGAVIANASAEGVDIMGRIGTNIGIAFQIIDDSIDLLGNNKSKSLHNDLKQGKATPMLIHALKNAGSRDKKFLINIVGNGAVKKDIGRVIDIYRETGAIEYAQRLSGVYIEKARKGIQKLKNKKGINKKALKILEEVVDVMGYWALLGN